MADDKAGLRISVRGVVQGVGFRPFIYTLANRHGLTGWVRNTSSGVEIEVNGPQNELEGFVQTIQDNPPPLARIDQLETVSTKPNHYPAFEILISQADPSQFIPISPDISTCADCLNEFMNPQDRRYRYPFINCTNCGPRFTIIKDIPYDRPQTTMASFRMCPDCQAEYDNPLDRRFHAQPTACPVCGPQMSFVAGNKILAERDDALQIARKWLAEGKIIAVKGLGGYLIACDAFNTAAVELLRSRKHRSDKAFALMAFDLNEINHQCNVSQTEAGLLQSHASPIVLLDRKSTCEVSRSVAPHQDTLGFMLPYTPLHYLLLEPGPNMPGVLVMTSGNLSEEPIAYTDQDALSRLAGIVDGFLLHNRPVHMRMDDSVVRVIQNHSYPIRRSRGYAPDSIHLIKNSPPLLATGAELKNTFCLARDHYAFLSHHIGDLENYETLVSFEGGIEHYQHLFRVAPRYIACDMHPDYLASRYARERSSSESIPLIEVQHHHAHLAACLAENGWPDADPVIGLCYDGTGLGTDRSIWGGEVLVGGYSSFQRYYHLAYTPQPGGDAAARKPDRMALAHLWRSGLDWDPEIPAVSAMCAEDRTTLRIQLEKKINTPMTSSMGRLFDAVSSILGVRHHATYEGQAAIELEGLCDPLENGSYEFDLQADVFDPAPLLEKLLQDWREGIPLPIIAARFHNSIVELNLKICQTIRSSTGIKTIALSGGVWQNRYLLERTINGLEKSGFDVLWHQKVPANDGGIALGQASIACYAIQ